MKSVLIYFLLLSTMSFSQAGLQSAIDEFVAGQGLENASVSFEVYDMGSAKSLASHDKNTTLITASTAKLFSTATALDILGPDFKCTTRLYTDGEIDTNGRLNGNIYIRGAGDPSLGSKYFTTSGDALAFMNSWAAQLKKKGIKSVSGAIIADASEFGYYGAPDGWSWSDMGNYYGAGPSGLTLYDNLIEYTFSVPNALGQLSTLKKSEPYVPGLNFINYVKSSERKDDNAYIYGAPFTNERFATGTLPAGSSSFVVKGSLPDPEMQFAYEVDRILTENGISVDEEPKTVREMKITTGDNHYQKMQLLLSHKGVDLNKIIKETNFRSVNLFAEHMLNLVAYSKTGNGSTHTGIAQLNAHWSSRINTSGLEVADGSGLSRTNGISAHHFVELLNYMNTSKYATEFKQSLPVAGVSGTMVHVCKGETGDNRVSAKSGSMSRIRSYAGYINSVSGKKLSFALIVNNATCSSSVLKRRMEILFNKLAAY